MDFAVTAVALAVVAFAIQVPLDPEKTSLQRVLGAGVVLCMMVLILIVQFRLV